MKKQLANLKRKNSGNSDKSYEYEGGDEKLIDDINNLLKDFKMVKPIKSMYCRLRVLSLGNPRHNKSSTEILEKVLE